MKQCPWNIPIRSGKKEWSGNEGRGGSKENIEMSYSDSLEMKSLTFQDSFFARRENVKKDSELDNWKLNKTKKALFN